MLPPLDHAALPADNKENKAVVTVTIPPFTKVTPIHIEGKDEVLIKAERYLPETYSTKQHPEELTSADWQREMRDLTSHDILKAFGKISWEGNRKHIQIKWTLIDEKEWERGNQEHVFRKDNPKTVA
eukprot:TRINITY_DN553_c0_g1_i1.p1 TRINITY_DN553_c0_g1~~TRINITY_DN553_c0_g1_i1.p1  ORF type:complete len:127 (-),score=34.37 TRINITY_DN553_c0_g1_i1:100-480(-)